MQVMCFFYVVFYICKGDDAEGCEEVFGIRGFVLLETSFNFIFQSNLCLLSAFEIFLCVLMSVSSTILSSHFCILYCFHFAHKVALASVPSRIIFFQVHKEEPFFAEHYFCMQFSVLKGSTLAGFVCPHSFFAN